MNDKISYENFSHSNKNDVEKLLNSEEVDDVISGIIGAVNEIDDWEWLQNKCLNLINHDNFWVAKTAINSLGDIARIHKKMNSELVVNSLNLVKNSKLKGVVEECIDDILMFVPQTNV